LVKNQGEEKSGREVTLLALVNASVILALIPLEGLLFIPLSQTSCPCRMHRLGPVGNQELGENVGDMVAHRLVLTL
jgi:hypothetical protein